MPTLPLCILLTLAASLFSTWHPAQAIIVLAAPRIMAPALSDDGRLVAYALEKNGQEAQLIIRNTQDDVQFVLPLGPFEGDGLRFSAGAQQLIFGCAPRGVGEGRDLCLLDLGSRGVTRIADVSTHAIDSGSRYLSYGVAKGPGAGVFVRRLADGKITTLLTGEGEHRGLVFDKLGKRIAFLSDQGDTAGRFSLYLGSTEQAAERIVADANLRRSGETIAPEAETGFTGTGGAIRFGLVSAEPPKPAVAGGAAEVWHWRDPGSWWGRLPEGRWKPSSAVALRQVTLPTFYRIAERELARLGTPEFPFVLAGDGKIAVGVGGEISMPILKLRTKRERRFNFPADLYLLDSRLGQSELYRRDVPVINRYPGDPSDEVMPYFSLSPTGRYLTWYEDRRWKALDLQTHRDIDLTGTLLGQTDIGDERPCKLAGWTQGDRDLLLYDRHDIWMVDPLGNRAPRNVTAGIGRRDNIVFRLWEDAMLAGGAVGSTDDSATREIEINSARPMLLVVADMDTMATGVWQAHLDGRSPKKLMMVDKRITPIARARDAEHYLLSIEDHDDFPDIWVGSRFDALRRITDVEPKQSRSLRSRVELVSFTSDLGVPLKGKLVMPAGFDAKREYPMVVNVYEIQSNTFHRYAPPPGDADYLFFYPDIYPAAPYHPGPSAYAAVMPAVQAVIDRGYVDERRIALTGNSFGSYETSYILTRTDRFRCAISRSGLTNLIAYHGDPKSAYGPRYLEQGQAEMEVSPWEDMSNYIANSPVFHADKIRTPLLMMYNEADNAVPLAQGLEFFFALQRNGKPAWLVSYPGEGHVLEKKANQQDWDTKMRAFLDHCLKDASEPEWMKWPSTPSPFTKAPAVFAAGEWRWRGGSLWDW